MSQTSKVNLAVRNAIVTFLSPGTKSTNSGLNNFVFKNTMSKRAIQEATQKLTTEGVLTSTRENGKTWYALPAPTTVVMGAPSVAPAV